MVTAALPQFPVRLPSIDIEVIEEGTDLSVQCDELQWWFVVPRAGETSAARWYDRATGQITQSRETTRPVAPMASELGTVHISFMETTLGVNDEADRSSPIEITARRTENAAEFLSVDLGGERTATGDVDFAAQWGTSRGRALRDSHRLERLTPREFRSRHDDGIAVDLVDVTIDGVPHRSLRVLDL